jgi:hypothetical protein
LDRRRNSGYKIKRAGRDLAIVYWHNGNWEIEVVEDSGACAGTMGIGEMKLLRVRCLMRAAFGVFWEELSVVKVAT